MNRRTFLRDAGAVALGTACQAHALPLAFAERVPDASAPWSAVSGAVFDPSLAQGRELAREAARAGCVAWAIGDLADDLAVGDIGALWHARMARRLERAQDHGIWLEMRADVDDLHMICSALQVQRQFLADNCELLIINGERG